MPPERAPASPCWNTEGRDEIEQVVRRIEKIETAVEPLFQHHFVEAMAIPHKSAAYPNLSKAITLPTPKPVQALENGANVGAQRRS